MKQQLWLVTTWLETGAPRRKILTVCKDRISAVKALEQIGQIESSFKEEVRKFLEESSDYCVVFGGSENEWMKKTVNFGSIEAAEEYSSK